MNHCHPVPPVALGKSVSPRKSAPSLWLVATLVLSIVGGSAQAQYTDAQPDARYSPQQVVDILVKSLQLNDASSDDGIATVFRFASPANKMSTGPLPRFRRMIRQGYPDMLNHSSARFEPMTVSGDNALQAVWLTSPDGSEFGYAFQLRRQADGEFDDMWMTDAVLPLGPGAQSGLRI